MDSASGADCADLFASHSDVQAACLEVHRWLTESRSQSHLELPLRLRLVSQSRTRSHLGLPWPMDLPLGSRSDADFCPSAIPCACQEASGLSLRAMPPSDSASRLTSTCSCSLSNSADLPAVLHCEPES